MTTTLAHEVLRRTTRQPRRSANMAATLAARLRLEFPEPVDTSRVWPSPYYRDDPALFASEVFDLELTEQQVEIIQSVRDHVRTTVRSGHKCGKSLALAVLALWWWCSWPDARVVLTAPTARQVDGILWREIKRLVRLARYPLGAEPKELARSGMRAPDQREIVGFTAREAEAFAGISGAHLLFLVDEASGVGKAIFEAAQGNMAGGAKLALTSNPTKTSGFFFESHGPDRADLYNQIHISSEDTPTARGIKDVRGLATAAWIEEMRQEYGKDSPFYKVRVKGEFVLNEEGRIISLALIMEAEQRWDDAADDTGPLRIGLDPAGAGQQGDETVVALRRGSRINNVVAWRGLSEDAIVSQVMSLVDQHATVREPRPAIIVDALGSIGSSVYGRLRAAAHERERNNKLVQVDVIGVRSSDKAVREPMNYDRVRDELWANFARWLREGGAIPADSKLEKELHCPEWIPQVTGRLKATPKEEMRKQLERSPDRADACCLACWETSAIRPDNGAGPVGGAGQSGRPDRRLDPYSAMDVWG